MYSVTLYYIFWKEKGKRLLFTFHSQLFFFYCGWQKEPVILISRLLLHMHNMHVMASFNWTSTPGHSHEWNGRRANTVGAKVFWPLIIVTRTPFYPFFVYGNLKNKAWITKNGIVLPCIVKIYFYLPSNSFKRMVMCHLTTTSLMIHTLCFVSL